MDVGREVLRGERGREQLVERERAADAVGAGGVDEHVGRGRTRGSAAGSRRSGVVRRSPSAIVSTSTISCSPAATIAPIAAASAQMPSGYDAFSTLQPTKTRPDAVRNAAPTGKCEYGTWALACTARAASSRSAGPSDMRPA